MLTNWLILDVASAPIPDAASYVEGQVKAPSNYGPEAAAKFVAEKTAERVSLAATDIDLARITGVALLANFGDLRPYVYTASLVDEHFMLNSVVSALTLESDYQNRNVLGRERKHVSVPATTIITFGGFNFDLPLLMRRARYLGVDFPPINLDRYKSPHIDLCEVLSDRNPQRRRSLLFYAKRLGWTDISKPLSGAEEAQVPVTGKWDELAASLRHDVTATYRLACWLGIIQPQPEMSAAQMATGF